MNVIFIHFLNFKILKAIYKSNFKFVNFFQVFKDRFNKMNKIEYIFLSNGYVLEEHLIHL